MPARVSETQAIVGWLQVAGGAVFSGVRPRPRSPARRAATSVAEAEQGGQAAPSALLAPCRRWPACRHPGRRDQGGRQGAGPRLATAPFSAPVQPSLGLQRFRPVQPRQSSAKTLILAGLGAQTAGYHVPSVSGRLVCGFREGAWRARGRAGESPRNEGASLAGGRAEPGVLRLPPQPASGSRRFASSGGRSRDVCSTRRIRGGSVASV